VLAGEGYVILPWSAIYDFVAEGKLSAHRVSDLSRTISLYTPLTRPSTLAMDKVTEIVIKAVEDAYQQGIWLCELLID